MKNSIFRTWYIFRVLLSFFLLIKNRDSFLGLKAYSAKELQEVIIELGASFIKLAQVLATRADFFDEEYLNSLKTLHDELPPMKKEDFEIVFKRAFNKNNPFKSFDKNPIASASIGQVHIAYLKDNTKVAVKLRRLGIKKQVNKDIKTLRLMHTLFKPLFSTYTKNSLEAVIIEFSNMILQEVNLSIELKNLKKFSKTYNYCRVKFPFAYEEFCSEDAIVMSFEEGVRFDNKKALKEYGIDFKEIIKKLVNFYAEQMLVKGLFHADPHPGNLLINKDGDLILLDFGMVKQIPNDSRIAIIEMIKAAHERNFELYISAAKRLGVIAYEAPKTLMAQFVEQMFDIFSNENLSAIDMQKLAFEILESMRDLPFKLPQEAIYILRVSAIIEGLGTTYIPNFNGIKDILPILQENIPRALGYEDSLLKMFLKELKETPFIVNDFKETIKLASKGNMQVEMSPKQLEWLKNETKKELKKYIFSFALIFSSIFLILFDNSLKNYSAIIFIIAILNLFLI